MAKDPDVNNLLDEYIAWLQANHQIPLGQTILSWSSKTASHTLVANPDPWGRSGACGEPICQYLCEHRAPKSLHSVLPCGHSLKEVQRIWQQAEGTLIPRGDHVEIAVGTFFQTVRRRLLGLIMRGRHNEDKIVNPYSKVVKSLVTLVAAMVLPLLGPRGGHATTLYPVDYINRVKLDFVGDPWR